MFEQITLGIIQGIAEWLPVSSEGLIILAKTNLFHSHENIVGSVSQALFLHFGTFLAALIYFRQDVARLLKAIIQYSSQPKDTQKLLTFLLVSTIISGLLGLIFIKTLDHLTAQLDTQGKIITLIIGCLLLGTAWLELRSKNSGYREVKDLKIVDGILILKTASCLSGIRQRINSYRYD